MSAVKKHRVVSRGDGLFLIETLALPVGEETELIEVDDEEDQTRFGMLLAESSLAKYWNDPAEDIWDNHPTLT
jgi:hypothetical protein